MQTPMKIIYFAPYSAIWVHSVPEALTAQSLQDKGHEVVYVTCDGLFDAGCMSMSIYGISSHSDIKEREAIWRGEAEGKIISHSNVISNTP